MNPAFLTVLWSLIGAAVVVATVFLIRVLLQLQGLIRRIERSAEYLETRQPQIDRLLNGLEAELGELRGVTEKANRIAGTVDGVTSELRAAVQPAISQVGDLAQGLRTLRAAAAGVKTGIAAWRSLRQGERAETAPAPALIDDSEER